MEILDRFGVPYEKEVVSAHRTPVWMAEFAQGAENRGIQVIMPAPAAPPTCPAWSPRTLCSPCLGVPVNSARFRASIHCCRSCRCLAAFPWARWQSASRARSNAGLLAVGILATTRPDLRERLRQFRAEQTARVRQDALP